jgi:cytoskeletal protein CcmA (bactofilin family)
MDADSLSAEKPAEPVSIIRRGITVAGDLQGGEGLRIEGVFKGTITSSADVVVAAGGVAEARIQARRIVIQGQVQGDVSAEKSVAIHAAGRLIGDCRARAIEIREGALFEGRSEILK